jgi:sulfhydrogenase subunit delta
MAHHKPKLAVFKFASCDGCQLQVLDLQGRLPDLATRFEIAHFLEARSAVIAGPYDLGLVEGSISTPEDVDRIDQIRRECRMLVAIGACATAGGIQALRNWADHADWLNAVYAAPDYVASLATSTAIAAHVPIDLELRGCPIDTGQLLELLTAVLAGRQPRLPAHSVCVECKERGTVCVTVARGIPCLGPVTQAGCGAICPAHGRECFGCYGPTVQPNLVSLTDHHLRQGARRDDLGRLMRSFSGWAEPFHTASDRLLAVSDEGEPAAGP